MLCCCSTFLSISHRPSGEEDADGVNFALPRGLLVEAGEEDMGVDATPEIRLGRLDVVVPGKLLRACLGLLEGISSEVLPLQCCFSAATGSGRGGQRASLVGKVPFLAAGSGVCCCRGRTRTSQGHGAKCG